MSGPHRDGGAFGVCVELAALGPRETIEEFVAAGHQRIARALGAVGGFVGIGIRCRPPEGDPLDGWRLPLLYVIGPVNAAHVNASERVIEEESYLHDPIVQGVVREAGRHRVYHDPDPRLAPDRKNTIDFQFWSLLGLVDRLKLVYTVSPTTELHASFDRFTGAPFAASDVALLDEIAHGLEPWSRRLALLHGHAPGGAALSSREREVACALLGSDPVKLIAGRLGVSEPRARELVRAVYGKLGVTTRAELATLWAGERGENAEVEISRTRARRSVRDAKLTRRLA